MEIFLQLAETKFLVRTLGEAYDIVLKIIGFGIEERGLVENCT